MPRLLRSFAGSTILTVGMLAIIASRISAATSALTQVQNCSVSFERHSHSVHMVCTLVVNKINRLADPITVFDPPPPDVLYASTAAAISFTFANRTNKVATGRIVASEGGIDFPTAYWVVKLAPSAHLDGLVSIGPPLSTGEIKLRYDEGTAPPFQSGSVGSGLWKTITSITLPIQVLPVPQYVPTGTHQARPFSTRVFARATRKTAPSLAVRSTLHRLPGRTRRGGPSVA